MTNLRMSVRSNITLFLLLEILTLSSTVQADTTCSDTPFYLYHDHPAKDCDWVQRNHHCETEENGHVVGEYYCKVSCNKCNHEISSSSVVTDRQCYAYGEDIEVEFENENPEPDDWVGIYRVPLDTDDLGHPALWFWLCGNQYDNCKTLYGDLKFGSETPGETGTDHWPLDPGTYKAVLVRRNSRGPYSVYAESEQFEVRHPGISCDAVEPSSAPSGAPDPYQCEDYIDVDLDCYIIGEPIDIYFEQCEAKQYDWIGVYYEGANLDNLGHDYRLWVYACGNQNCGSQTDDGFVRFDWNYPHEGGTDIWPLNPGRYEVHMIRRTPGGPYESYATSRIFTVKGHYETCSAPSPPAPPGLPSSPPTSYPTEQSCINVIYPDRDCYIAGQSVHVSYETCSPHDTDVIAIYRDDVDPNFLGYPLVWMFACGSQSCIGNDVYFNIVRFGHGYPVEIGTQAWPLPPGSYKVFLVRASNTYYHHAVASSETFYIKEHGQSCSA